MPYIYEDRISQRDFEKALTSALKNPTKKYRQMASHGRRHVLKSYNFEKFEKSWVELMDNVTTEMGSWETRTGYDRWLLMEVA